jgi:hypothetical protein
MGAAFPQGVTPPQHATDIGLQTAARIGTRRATQRSADRPAARVAGWIVDPERQARMLAVAAEALAQQDSDSARRPLARALTSSSWLEAMPVLARLAPEAALSTTEAMLRPL